MVSAVQDQSAVRKVAVWFTHKRESTADVLYHGRIFIAGVADIRTEEALLTVEGLLLERAQVAAPDAHTVVVTNWRSLEG